MKKGKINMKGNFLIIMKIKMKINQKEVKENGYVNFALI